jgi:hypothetical protein
MLTITASVVFVPSLPWRPSLRLRRRTITAGNGSGKKMLRAETAMSKDGEKGDKGGGKSEGRPDTSLEYKG